MAPARLGNPAAGGQKWLTGGRYVVTSYHMNSSLVRTSVSLDRLTLDTLDHLANRWSVSKAEVMRRSIRKAKEDNDLESRRPSPLDALRWLQEGGGLSVAENAEFKREIQAERDAKRLWWEK